jgi:thiamine biosynthesis lipoprotein
MLAEQLPDSLAGSAGYRVHYTRRAMACDFEVILPFGERESCAKRAMAGLDLVEQLEQQLSVYRPDSDVCRFNSAPPNEPVPLPLACFELVELSVRLANQTAGAFDLTAGALDNLWRAARRNATPPSELEVQAALACCGFEYLQLDPGQRTVTKLRDGLELNFGGIGKGFALDHAAAKLREHGVSHALLQAGNSSVLAVGPEKKSDASPWEIGIANPLEANRRVGKIELRSEALSTSSSQLQSFEYQGRTYGHIIDPRIGWPANGVLSVTVMAPIAATAEAISTACYVLGPSAANDVLRSFPNVTAIFLLSNHESATVELLEIGPPRLC